MYSEKFVPFRVFLSDLMQDLLCFCKEKQLNFSPRLCCILEKTEQNLTLFGVSDDPFWSRC
jgi:hypothetical protein